MGPTARFRRQRRDTARGRSLPTALHRCRRLSCASANSPALSLSLTHTQTHTHTHTHTAVICISRITCWRLAVGVREHAGQEEQQQHSSREAQDGRATSKRASEQAAVEPSTSKHAAGNGRQATCGGWLWEADLIGPMAGGSEGLHRASNRASASRQGARDTGSSKQHREPPNQHLLAPIACQAAAASARAYGWRRRR